MILFAFHPFTSEWLSCHRGSEGGRGRCFVGRIASVLRARAPCQFLRREVPRPSHLQPELCESHSRRGRSPFPASVSHVNCAPDCLRTSRSPSRLPHTLPCLVRHQFTELLHSLGGGLPLILRILKYPSQQRPRSKVATQFNGNF